MKRPSNCPICHQPMTNTYETGYVLQKCNKFSNHQIEFSSKENEEVFRIRMWMYKDLYAYWFPVVLTAAIEPGHLMPLGLFNLIPYFEPDFSDYKKLISKLKTYLIFS